MESLITAIRNRVFTHAPELLNLFNIYANEARFGRKWLDNDLNRLRPEDEILEVGAGMLLLACQLKYEGFSITALEPVEKGFSHFYRLKQIVLDYAAEQNIAPSILSCSAEELAQKNRYTFAYSLNVMEHVNDVKTVLEHIRDALKPEGEYRFVCPNYAFPYENHFGILTFGSKKSTERFMRRKIENSLLPDRQKVWDSLNWITVIQVKQLCHHLQLTPIFDKAIISMYFDRALNDPIFQIRHSLLLRRILSVMHALKVDAIAQCIPAPCLPVMDCRIQRKKHA